MNALRACAAFGAGPPPTLDDAFWRAPFPTNLLVGLIYVLMGLLLVLQQPMRLALIDCCSCWHRWLRCAGSCRRPMAGPAVGQFDRRNGERRLCPRLQRLGQPLPHLVAAVRRGRIQRMGRWRRALDYEPGSISVWPRPVASGTCAGFAGASTGWPVWPSRGQRHGRHACSAQPTACVRDSGRCLPICWRRPLNSPPLVSSTSDGRERAAAAWTAARPPTLDQAVAEALGKGTCAAIPRANALPR
jgi:hypothetical protein